METGILCVGGIAFFGLLFGSIVLIRYINYRETLALAEKGLVRPQRERTNGSRAVLVWGIIIGAIGLALTLGLWPLGLTGMGVAYPLGFGPWMLIGLLPLFFGLALVLIYVLTYQEKKPEAPVTPEPIVQTMAPLVESFDPEPLGTEPVDTDQ
jgi:hypothetical protein